MFMEIKRSARLLRGVAVVGAMLLPVAARADLKVVSLVTVKGTPTNVPGVPKTSAPVTTTTYFKGDKSRTETADGVTLTDLASGKVYTLDPVKKTYSVTTLSDLEKQVGDLPLGNFKISTQTTVTPGTENKVLLGKTTKPYTYTSSFTLSVEGNDTLNAFLPTVKIEGQTWNSEEVKQPGDPLKMAQSTYTRMLPPTLRKGVKEMSDKLSVIKGFPLLSMVTVTVTPPANAPDFVRDQIPKEPIVTTTEVKSVSDEPLADDLFTPPADYKEVKVPAPSFPGTP